MIQQFRRITSHEPIRLATHLHAMTTKPQCGNCRFYKDFGFRVGTRCRRHSPVFVLRDVDDFESKCRAWPSVNEDDWCGEHRPVIDPTINDELVEAWERRDVTPSPQSIKVVTVKELWEIWAKESPLNAPTPSEPLIPSPEPTTPVIAPESQETDDSEYSLLQKMAKVWV